MRQRLLSLNLLVTLLVAVAAAPAEAYYTQTRWSRTATDGNDVGPWGSAVTVTWSLAPDGTTIPGNTVGSTVSSGLISFLDTTFGAGSGGSDFTQRPWFWMFDQSFARISALSGLTYDYEPNDDKRRFADSSSAHGVLGVRGDVRIGGRSYGAGSNVLASNYYPNYGEMIFNTDRGSYFSLSTNDYRRMRNTIMHEALHGLGIRHVVSNNAAFLMEPTLQTSFDGPQLDDLLALHRLYGDRYEKNGGNNSYETATPLGPLSPMQSIAIGTLGDSTVIGANQVDFVSISGNPDLDFFSFMIDERLDVSLQLTPRGTTYNQAPQTESPSTQTPFNTLALSNLALALFDTNGTSMLVYANHNPAGVGEEILHQLLPGTYYARVTGAAANEVQLYGLNLSAAVPLPKDLLWVGNESANWTVAGAANFHDGSGSAMFFDLDHVTFDDSSAVTAVNVPSHVGPASIRVTTDAGYTFSGAGSIATESLTIDGAGIVELANAGNSHYSNVQIASGTLKVSGAATFSGAVQVAQDARLELAGAQVFEISSQLSGGGLVAGDVVMPGTIAPGNSIGTLTFADNLTLLADSRVEIELSGTAAGIEYDVLHVDGLANLAGIIDVSLLGGFLPALGSSFEVLRAESGIFGQFDQLALPALASDLAWNVVYSNFAVLLQVIDPNVAALPGDFNHDGVVDAADYILWRKSLGLPELYDEWRANFGATLAGSGAGDVLPSETAVPEPGSLLLLLLGLAGLPFARRCRRYFF